MSPSAGLFEIDAFCEGESYPVTILICGRRVSL
jgi:hypothetical protein